MLKRRTFVMSLAAAGAMPLASKPVQSDTATSDANDLVDTLMAFVKLRGSLRRELTVWWFEGRVYGVLDQQVRALWDLQTVKFEHFRRIDEHTYGVKSLELTYPFDLDTGAPLSSIVNPYTNEEIQLGYGKFGPNDLLLTEAGFAIPPARANQFPAELTSSLDAVLVHDDDIWLSEKTSLRIGPLSDGGRVLNATDVNLYAGTAREISDTSLASAKATMSYTVILSWQAFMKMGDRPGHMMRRMAGKKLFSRDALPTDFVALADQEDPGLIQDAAMLVGLDED